MYNVKSVVPSHAHTTALPALVKDVPVFTDVDVPLNAVMLEQVEHVLPGFSQFMDHPKPLTSALNDTVTAVLAPAVAVDGARL